MYREWLKVIPKILLIDDNDLVRRALSSLLAFEGFDVVECNSGRQGVDMFHSENPDLVITDLLMTDMSGVDVMGEIRKDCPDMRFVVVTGGGGTHDRELVQRAREAGADVVMMKPIDNDEFIATVRELSG